MVKENQFNYPVKVFTSLEGCKTEGEITSKQLPGKGFEYTRLMKNNTRNVSCSLTEKFIPSKEGIHCEIEIRGSGAPWTTAIKTNINYAATKSSRFWTAWSDTRRKEVIASNKEFYECNLSFEENWSDPLQPQAFRDDTLYYGASYFKYNNTLVGYIPFQRNLFCIPIVSILEEKKDAGMSIVLNPDDDILDMTMQVHSDGNISFNRIFNRISNKNVLRFSFDIITHEADWRGGLRYMTNKYPEYFYPANPKADTMAGTAAYSAGQDVDFDIAKMKKMAFKVNWMASFDFPYMGMFIPPVDEKTKWIRFGGGTTSIARMQQYAKKMKDMGFHVLNYFNVTEFGTKMKYPLTSNNIPNDSVVWKDANAFFYYHLKDAILPVPDRAISPNGRNYKGVWFSWEGAIATDPGEPVYKEFLLDQAKKHIQYFPASDGVCIDRMDWLRMYNEDRDDGISWYYDRPARSLISSWKGLMKDFCPLMHENDKVIFVNNHTKRIDLLKNIDGIFDEFTYGGSPLNLTAFLCIERPALGWTQDTVSIKREGTDNFFQKYLYMGVYPMAPFPGNDHSLLPDEWVDKQYLDYGPLLSAMRGRKWVLEPHCLEVVKKLAKANLFKVPGGYVVPVVFGGKAEKVTIYIRNISQLENVVCKAIYPGSEVTAILKAKFNDGSLQIQVPLVRGCAMVKIENVK